HAVLAAEVAAIGDRDAEIADQAAVAIAEGLTLHPYKPRGHARWVVIARQSWDSLASSPKATMSCWPSLARMYERSTASRVKPARSATPCEATLPVAASRSTRSSPSARKPHRQISRTARVAWPWPRASRANQ